MVGVIDRFGGRANEYVAGRPSYPEAVLADLPLAEARVIVEIGAGTGKFTRLLARTGKRVVAVEPSPRMAAHIRAEAGEAPEIVHAAAEKVPLPDGSTDLICVATAFHWFDYGPATAEIHRLLRSGSHLALLWNLRDERVPWVAALSRLLEAYASEPPRRASGKWRAILSDERFRLVKEVRHPFRQPMTHQGIYDRVFSTSYIVSLQTAEQDKVRAAVAAVIAGEPALGDAEHVEFPYVTELHLLQRVP